MDYNIAIISLGGVERILASGPLTLTDAELEAHIAHNVIGTKHSVSDVKAQVLVLEQEVNNNAYKFKRALEYPDFKEYLDGIVKGDQAQIDKYIADCQAVKAKYPKGSE